MNLRSFLLAFAFTATLAAHGAPTAATRPAPVLGDAPRVATDLVAFRAAQSSALAASAAVYGDSSYGLTVDTSKREQSRLFYQTVYQASQNVVSGWAGSATTGAPGTTKQAFRDATALRLDYFRAMAGIPAAITFADSYNAKDQQAALMMSANQSLSHFPPVTWLWYTADGALAASSSNLSYGSNGPDAIDGYIQDPGANNAAGGHRRWVLYPAQTVMGTGDVDASGNYGAANALWTLDPTALAAAKPSARDGFVAWPPAGYVPYQLVFPRWSFSYVGADFSGATVTMQRNGQNVAVRPETISPGFGENTLIWVPDGQGTDFVTPTAPANGADVPYSVTVANVKTLSGLQTFTYQVTAFDPSKPGADTVLPNLTGPAQLTVGTPGSYHFDAVPGAAAYRWVAWPVTALSLLLDAENGPGAMTVFPVGADLRGTTAGQTGTMCYQLNSGPAVGSLATIFPGSVGMSLTLNAPLLLGAGSQLQFNAKLGYNLSGEIASIQVSTDDGANWQNVLSQAGTGQAEAAFSAKSVDLSAFAGKTVRVRFVYSAAMGQRFYTRFADTGWFLDDITVTNARTVGTAAPTAVADGAVGFDFAPAAGTYALQVTPLFFGGYAANAGKLLFVDATTGGGTGGGGTGGGGTGGGGIGSGVPEVTVKASAPTAKAGGAAGMLTLIRTGDLTSALTIAYKVKGTAANGSDYTLLSGKQKMKAGKASAKIVVQPLGAAAGGTVTKVIKFTVKPGAGYTVGAAATAKVKVVW